MARNMSGNELRTGTKRCILGILGSPNPAGNTALLLSSVLRGIESAGLETGLIRLPEFNISPCLGCGYCKLHMRCAVQDGMSGIYPELETAGGIVLASPIYFMGLNAQTKSMIDRCQGYWFAHVEERSSIPPKRRPGLFVATAGGRWTRTPQRDPFAGAKSVVRAFFKTLNVAYWGELIVDDTDHTPIKDRSDILSQAAEKGRDMAYELTRSA